MADIKASDLIAKFQYALDHKGGYIWGATGGIWTEAQQKAATREMTKKYGAQWIGHRVWDCSGLFYWAFKELGGYMYHGSNTMYKSYCTNKGKLSGGKRSDRQELKPGTSVYTGTENDHGHVGLYIGNGEVIEAKGTQSGIIKSKVSDKKWTYWGELKGVSYNSTPTPAPEPEPEKGTAVVTGKNVALRYGPTTSAGIITRIATDKVVKLATPPEEWQYVEYEGKRGYMMKEYLKIKE